MKRLLSLLSCFLLLFVNVSYGSEIQTQQNTLYPFNSTLRVQDDFVSGGVTSTTIGSLGWTFAGGTYASIPSEAGTPGINRLDTSAVINTIARTIMKGQNDVVDPSLPLSVTFRARLNTNDANTTLRVGMINAGSANPPGNGIYFEKLDADTNWFCVCRNGGVQTRTDSGIAITTNFVNLTYVRNTSGVLFYIGGVLGCTVTTNIGPTFITPGVQIVNSAAAAKNVDIDYFQLILNGLTR